MLLAQYTRSTGPTDRRTHSAFEDFMNAEEVVYEHTHVPSLQSTRIIGL